MFRDEIMELIIDLLWEEGDTMSLDLVMHKAVNGGRFVGLGRSLVADFIIFGGKTTLIEDLYTKFGKVQGAAFCEEVTRAAIEKAIGERSKAPWDDRCAYHTRCGGREVPSRERVIWSGGTTACSRADRSSKSI